MQKQQYKISLIHSVIADKYADLSFASVPIYSLFCKATGFGGTVKRQESL